MAQRGRPLGTTGPREPREVVQVLKPIHERVVLLHLALYSNVEIAEALELTPEYVGQILLDPKAKALIQKGRNAVVNGLMQEIDHQTLRLAKKSLDNLEKTIDAKIPVSHRMKPHQDKVGLELLKMIGYGKDDNSKNSEEAHSPELLDRLTRALERSERVASSGLGNEIQDAEVVVKDGTDG